MYRLYFYDWDEDMQTKLKQRITKIIGYISDDLMRKYNFSITNTEIIQSLDFYIHISKHIQEFSNIDSYNNSVDNLELIINDPYYVTYDTKRKSLLYYKKIDEFVCLVVKVTNSKDHYVATLYPVSEQKIINKMKTELMTMK